MEKKEENTLESTSKGEGENCPGVQGANTGAVPQDNEGLKKVYDEMHSRGPGAWFDDGAEEREAILKMGEPWHNKTVLEVGCGEGDLTNMIANTDVSLICATDYSQVAINKAKEKYPIPPFSSTPYRELPVSAPWRRIVLQGVLEHLDNPFVELKWMMDNLLLPGGDVITSSPCFLNPRGIVWMTLNMLGAVMSKTDLHFIDPWDFLGFCMENGYKLKKESCNWSWGIYEKMILDLKQRIPLALKDGNLPFNPLKLNQFLEWYEKFAKYFDFYQEDEGYSFFGATMVYKITKGA